MMEYVIRFIVGGVAVSAFAVLGDVLRPKSFAGLFGAAPSIAMATLGIAIAQHGNAYAAIEARSMMIGAIALWLYSAGVCRVMKRHHVSALAATCSMLALWLVCAFGLEWLLLGNGR
jgi:hypothetical protein